MKNRSAARLQLTPAKGEATASGSLGLKTGKQEDKGLVPGGENQAVLMYEGVRKKVQPIQGIVEALNNGRLVSTPFSGKLLNVWC